MPISNFTAFYPSRPFWAGSAVDFTNQSYDGWFHDQMAEEVHESVGSNHTLKVCRDGRVMLRVEGLEIERPGEDAGESPPIEHTVNSWGRYLDYLNSFYLILDSATIEIDKFAHFSLHEITNRDAFRVRYERGKSVGENIAIESIASVFQMGRYSSSYRNDIPIQFDTRLSMRQVVSLCAIDHAAKLFKNVMASPGLERTFASLARSISEYKVGNYETAIVLAWFVIEASINKLWREHIRSLNEDMPGGRSRINRERRDYLTGRDFPISAMSNMLELFRVLPNDVFRDIDSARGFRNKIVHALDFAPGAKEASLTIKTAQKMIERLSKIQFKINLSYSVASL